MKLRLSQNRYPHQGNLFQKILIKEQKARLAEIESDLQNIAGKISKMNSEL